ncbi:bifunctional acetate--CoA ligase family protein/GNAT family N-acetyltransferase [Azospirillum rugosum]|uniref:Acyl-CoA synthetase (NDP forming)/RimJ/RimL family protein N-acetyltransferase n=1 Tax=Azospirillum rugosum TaxID=416170 RepID=A0ABS4SWS4_9PROT|nr:GNAT family N-acetyltransferase [Azospirillum rugosum]MBP2296922.1 acyl-CoA synthetase (NDP forming)/RimJ/RimL family protein N-acetyltransferase [Azospirillum rugosum]MDQ0530681.1 acyl-CoA synthetase (NDP forming)/RimJ/RimL family protein N-acetyltransferase [Azospirillum rugosum]
MPVRDLDALFRPKGVAVVADGDPPLARVAARNLAGGYGGVVQRVETSALGGLASVPELVLIAAPAERLPALVAQAGKGGAKAAILLGGHGDGDPNLADALKDAARGSGLRLLGPGSLGVAMPGKRFCAGAFHRAPPAGRVALVAQSGTLAGAVVDWAQRRSVGFSHVAVTGDGADIGPGDLLDYLAAQDDCHAILLVLDRPPEARRFVSAARAAARQRPVIVLRTGRGEGGDAVFDAAIRRAGLLRVFTLEELFDALETLAVAAPIRGDRLAIVANGRGVGRLAADALLDGIGRLAVPAGLSNPLDLGEGAEGAAYAGVLSRLCADPAVDAVLLLHAPTALVPAGEIARTVAAAIDTHSRTPVLTSWLGERDADHAAAELARHRIPVFDTPDRAVRAFQHALAFRRNQELLAETPRSTPEDVRPDLEAARRAVATAREAGRVALTEAEVGALLAAYGVPLGGADAVPGHDLAVGLSEDRHFGPVITVGHLTARLAGETAVALPPLTMTLACDALRRVPAVTLAEEEGLAPAARDAAAALLVKVAQIAVDLEDVAHLTLAPLRLGPEGPVVGGASVRLVEAGRRRAPFAILPYPSDLERPLPLADGRSLLVRPLVPEDEPAMKALFKRLTPAEIRLRFFTQKQELSHGIAARMSQLDYDREMGLAVADPGRPGTTALHGVVHLARAADGERAEFAIMLAHDMAGLGLGPVLMRRILDHARAKGLKEVYGEVLHENRAMLRLCEAFGFQRRSSPDDPGVTHVVLAL